MELLPDMHVFWAPAPLEHETIAGSGSRVRLCEGWERRIRDAYVKVYPPSIVAAAATDPLAKKMKQGLKAALPSQPKQRKSQGRQGGVRIMLPRGAPAEGAQPVAQAGERSSTDAGSDDDSAEERGRRISDEDLEMPEPSPPPHPHREARSPRVAAAASRHPSAGPDVAPPQRNRAGLPRGHDGRPWRHWNVGDGFIAYDDARRSLGAHCTVPSHGLCRANKILARLPLGYLVSWLEHPRLHRSCDNRAKHVEVQAWLCSAQGYEIRKSARAWLMQRESEYRDLLDLERPFHRTGSFDEPITVKR